MATGKKTTKKNIADKTAVSDMKTVDELQAALVAAEGELIEAKQSHAARELANTESLKKLRIRIAQIKTILNKRDTTEESA
jgi:ribosomal protein L29